MRFFFSILLGGFLLTGMFACHERDIQKPDKLVEKKKMIRMLADIHMAQAISERQYGVPDSLRLSSLDFYYSVLEKYKVSDSVFVRSVIYYSSLPREYEQMYNDVLNILKAKEETTEEKRELNIGNKNTDKKDLKLPDKNLK